MRKVDVIRTGAIAFILLGAASAVPAQAGLMDSIGSSAGLPSVGGTAPSGSGQQDQSANLSADLTGISKTFANSFHAMCMAESVSAEALGLKDQADAAEKLADDYSKGNINSWDQVARDMQTSDDTEKAISEKMAQNTALDADAKAKLAKAVPFYVAGTLNAATLPGKYAAWVKKAQAGVGAIKSNPMSLASNGWVTDVPNIANVTTQLPDLVSQWGSVTKKFVAFAHTQNVDTGDLSSKIGKL
ncbi:MAG: hypothetical protein WCD70_12450 [Alphaproteobacteria bacterium]